MFTIQVRRQHETNKQKNVESKAPKKKTGEIKNQCAENQPSN
jgi:hypothetical protein